MRVFRGVAEGFRLAPKTRQIVARYTAFMIPIAFPRLVSSSVSVRQRTPIRPLKPEIYSVKDKPVHMAHVQSGGRQNRTEHVRSRISLIVRDRLRDVRRRRAAGKREADVAERDVLDLQPIRTAY